jgi:hypothetical protein
MKRITKWKKKKYIFWLGMLIPFLLLVSACSGGRSIPFELVDSKQKLKTGTVAVISGRNSEFGVRLAAAVTQELEQKSSFHTMSQEEIKRRIPNYPADIITSWYPAKGQEYNPAQLSHHDKNKIKQVQSALKTDYVFVVWNDNLTKEQSVNTGFFTVHYMYWSWIFTRLLEYPTNKLVGYSSFTVSKSTGTSFMVTRQGDDDVKYVNLLIQDAAGSIVNGVQDSTTPPSKLSGQETQ